MSDNTKLWDTLKETEIKWTKPGQNNLTSINGMYCVMRATEVFGPCGIGWGWEILEERYDEGSEHTHTDEKTKQLIDYKAITHTIKIKLWYEFEGKRGEIIHFGHTPFIMRSKYGPYQDEEAPKKSLTDAIKKSLSMIGIGADIHLGQFEDVNYKNELMIKEKQQREKKEDKKNDDAREEINKIITNSGVVYAACKTLPALNQAHAKAQKSARRCLETVGVNPKNRIDQLVNFYNQAKEIIEGVKK